MYLICSASHMLIHISKRMKKHLEPLALAVCITQTAHCCLDQVLLIFGLLYAEYQQLINEGDDSAGLMAILDSIESRWRSVIKRFLLLPLYSIPSTRQCHLQTCQS